MQSIFRVYRFGQDKPCYIYRLLSQGTMEEKIYNRQVTKQSLAMRVVDEQQLDRHFTQSELKELYNFQPDIWDESRQHDTPVLPSDPVLAELLKSSGKWISRYHEHDTLLQNREDEGLSEAERKAAWKEYEAEKHGSTKFNSSLSYGLNTDELSMRSDVFSFPEDSDRESSLLLKPSRNSSKKKSKKTLEPLKRHALQLQQMVSSGSQNAKAKSDPKIISSPICIE
jgi:transcriptional regulator ATRX